MTNISTSFSPMCYLASKMRDRAQQISHMDSMCSVCLEEVNIKDLTLLTLPCSHVFHRSCVEAWLAEKSTCPVCRKTVDASMQKLLLLAQARRIKRAKQRRSVSKEDISGQIKTSQTKDYTYLKLTALDETSSKQLKPEKLHRNNIPVSFKGKPNENFRRRAFVKRKSRKARCKFKHCQFSIPKTQERHRYLSRLSASQGPFTVLHRPLKKHSLSAQQERNRSKVVTKSHTVPLLRKNQRPVTTALTSVAFKPKAKEQGSIETVATIAAADQNKYVHSGDAYADLQSIEDNMDLYDESNLLQMVQSLRLQTQHEAVIAKKQADEARQVCACRLQKNITSLLHLENILMLIFIKSL